jgi:hypothetical protein
MVKEKLLFPSPIMPNQPLTIRIEASPIPPAPVNLTIDIALISAVAVLLGTLVGALWRSFSYLAALNLRIVRLEDELKEQAAALQKLRGRAGSSIQVFEFRITNLEAFLAHKHNYRPREAFPRAGDATGADFLDRA